MSVIQSLKTNKVVQYILGVFPLILFVSYIVLLGYDYVMVYGTSMRNAELVKKDDKIIKVVSWEVTEDDKLEILDSDGKEHLYGLPEFSLVLDSALGNKHLSYYSKDAKMLMQPIDAEYIDEFLRGYNIYLVMSCIVCSWMMYLYIYKYGKFTVLSRRVFFVSYTIVTIASGVIIIMMYWLMQ